MLDNRRLVCQSVSMVEGYRCPECNGDNLVKFGTKWGKVDGKRQLKQQYQCCDCGRITINPISENKKEK